MLRAEAPGSQWYKSERKTQGLGIRGNTGASLGIPIQRNLEWWLLRKGENACLSSRILHLLFWSCLELHLIGWWWTTKEKQVFLSPVIQCHVHLETSSQTPGNVAWLYLWLFLHQVMLIPKIIHPVREGKFLQTILCLLPLHYYSYGDI